MGRSAGPCCAAGEERFQGVGKSFRLVVVQHGLPSPLHYHSFWYTVAAVVICHAVARGGLWKRMAPRLPAPVMGFGYALVLTLALLLAPATEKAFIYFQF